MVYTFDILSSSIVNRLRAHRDAVSAIAFNPISPQLAAGAYDGTIAFFT
jgi:WD40 repeat protein